MPKFQITEQQEKLARQFMDAKRRQEGCGAIGGQFTWSFTPTTIGLIVHVTDNVSKEFADLTDYDSF